MKSTYIVTPNYPPEICGIGDYSSFLFKNLQENNIDVHIITFSENVIETDHIHLIKKADQKKISSWLKCLKHKDGVQTIIFQYEPYSFSKIGIPLYLIYISLLLKLRGYNLSVMFHEVATRLYVANPKKVIVSVLQLTIAYFITALSSIRATSTSFNAKQLKPFSFTFLPISSNFSKAENDKKTINPIFRIGCFANRVDDFFAAVVDQVLQKNLGEVYLIGKQSKANNEVWKKYSFSNRNNLVITGTLSANEIEDCFDKLDIFIHMEKIDPKGRGGASLKNGSLAAALNWSLPVITSKGDMTDETMLQNKKNIYFTNNPYNVSDWVDAVENLINNHDLKSNIQKKAFQFYNQNLSWPVITKKYISLINNIPPF
jgi:glycosyltransferase involved in cell wall biosynthesis